jgi:RNA polymerase subunit RPABC4/transcription elongation factor Spt4
MGMFKNQSYDRKGYGGPIPRRCRQCNTVISDTAKYCPQCGAPQVCAQCGGNLSAHDIFCPSCGKGQIKNNPSDSSQNNINPLPNQKEFLPKKTDFINYVITRAGTKYLDIIGKISDQYITYNRNGMVCLNEDFELSMKSDYSVEYWLIKSDTSGVGDYFILWYCPSNIEGREEIGYCTSLNKHYIDNILPFLAEQLNNP